MISAEQARGELQRVGGQTEKQVRRVMRLRGESGHAARALLGYLLEPADRVEMGADQIGRVVDDLPPRRRSKLFRALHPPLAETLAAAWEELIADPYTLGQARRPFRAPANPAASHAARATWLSTVAATAGAFERDARWFATWAGHLHGAAPSLGRLLGVAIDQGDRAVFDTIVATLRGQHEIGRMGRHVPAALLSCRQPGAWEEVERLLLAAQRQEGLRQVILETVDLAHPDAFRRMLRLVVAEGLTRFAATVRAVGVWLGTQFEVRDRKLVDALLSELLTYLGDSTARSEAIAGADAGSSYLGLWALAYTDAMAASRHAIAMLADPDADRRLVAARMLDALQLPEAASALLSALADEDLRVAAVSFFALQSGGWDFGGKAFEPLVALLDRVGRDTTVPLAIWKPEEVKLSASDVADTAMQHIGDQPATVVRPIVDRMSATGRARYARLLAKEPRRYRSELLDLAGDRSDLVRQTVFAAIERGPAPTADEATRLEHLLRRKSADLRRGVMQLLLAQPDDAAAASAERLLAGKPPQSEAAVEMIAALKAAGRAPAHTARLMSAMADDERTPTPDRDRLERNAAPARPRACEVDARHRCCVAVARRLARRAPRPGGNRGGLARPEG